MSHLTKLFGAVVAGGVLAAIGFRAPDAAAPAPKNADEPSTAAADAGFRYRRELRLTLHSMEQHLPALEKGAPSMTQEDCLLNALQQRRVELGLIPIERHDALAKEADKIRPDAVAQQENQLLERFERAMQKSCPSPKKPQP